MPSYRLSSISIMVAIIMDDLHNNINTAMHKKIVILGVSGCGKTTIGEMLANHLDYPFFDGDDFHSDTNIKKMKQGIALNDKDREEWLNTLNQLLQSQSSTVIACSALKPEYRSILKENNDDLLFIYLKGSFDEIWNRLQKRQGHYFEGKSMLENQFSTLVEPSESEAVTTIDIEYSPKHIVALILEELQTKQYTNNISLNSHHETTTL